MAKRNKKIKGAKTARVVKSSSTYDSKDKDEFFNIPDEYHFKRRKSFIKNNFSTSGTDYSEISFTVKEKNKYYSTSGNVTNQKVDNYYYKNDEGTHSTQGKSFKDVDISSEDISDIIKTHKFNASTHSTSGLNFKSENEKSKQIYIYPASTSSTSGQKEDKQESNFLSFSFNNSTSLEKNTFQNSKNTSLKQGKKGKLKEEKNIQNIGKDENEISQKEKYKDLIENNLSEIYWKDVKIYDSMTCRMNIDVREQYLIIGSKKYPYYGIHIKKK